MRPVNLIPHDERRGETAPTRTGPLAYVVVGVLALALAAVCGVVVFDKRVDERKAEAAALERQAAEVQARAASLASFTTFQQLHDARLVTVDQLARSRFDWERVLDELSRVVPKHVWLTTLNGSVASGTGGSADTGGLRASIPGPALEMTGCGKSHRDVARLVAAMKDIDGVTRVIATDSAKGDAEVAPASGTEEAATSGGNCQTRTVPQFTLIAAFDEVAPTVDPDGVAIAPEVPVTTTTSPAEDGGVAGAQDQAAASQSEVAGSRQRAEKATNLVPGG